jgi:hypothetical protein
MIGAGIVIGPELERVVRVAPIGFQLWDPVAGRPVTQGLEVVWRRDADRAVTATAGPSGVFSVRGVAAFAAFERGAGDDAFWASPPAAPSAGTIEVTDRLGRYLPFRFQPDAPARVGRVAREVCGAPAGGTLGISSGSPPEPAMPILPLFSAAGRPAPAGMARLSAQLVSIDGQPAAGAILRVTGPGDPPTYGLADGRGVVTVLFTYPRPSQPLLSPPASDAGSAATQHWDDVAIRAYWAPGPPEPHPDLCDLLDQIDTSPVTLLNSVSPLAELSEVHLDFGRPLDVRTAGRSVLVLDPGSPPSR